MWGRRACIAVGGFVAGKMATSHHSASAFWGGGSKAEEPLDAAGLKESLFRYQPPFPINPDNGVVFFEIEAEGEPLGRVEIEVFDDESPGLALNFKALAQGFYLGYPISSKKKHRTRQGQARRFLRYKNTVFHNVIPGYICQGGDNECFDGRGGESYCGDPLRDSYRGKGGKIPGPGCVCTVGHDRHSNKSQFMISFRALPHVEGRNSCIGQVISGWETMQKISDLATISGKTRKEVSIADCGILKHKTGELYDHMDPLSVQPPAHYLEEEKTARGAVHLTRVETPRKLDYLDHWISNRGTSPQHWQHDKRSGDGTGHAEVETEVLRADPSECC
eukprot:TRINITY_DN59202_c0_g1_i1.p1 TRINITY_DN59202_c0_g1~~TRINITY_DN59202_c0_g1_i1.p1  ORF type:complete len:334 (+),score=94.11 TRINITY_DN59202_c0_g1_i1:242-1243(+)